MPPFVRSYNRLALLIIPLAIAIGSMAVASRAAAEPTKSARHGSRYLSLLVTLRAQSSPRSLSRVVGGLEVRRQRVLRDLHVVVIRVPRRHAHALLARLAHSRVVKHVERNRVTLRITAANFAQETPTDPLWPQQWGPALVQAPTAWTVAQGSPSVVVAVLDTGVDFSQPDLQGAFVPGYDFVHNDPDPSDDHGHGTNVAGVIAARANNGVGVAGICPKCSLMPVKVVGADGNASEANVAAGITWAADHGARVINISLGGTFGATVANAISYATSKGLLVVAAAGNNGDSNAFYPAADPGVLGVAATQPNDQLFPWSNHGSWVAVAAPGCDVSTARGAQYVEFCGTSAATPLVSGLAALAISYKPTASTDTVIRAITSSAHATAGTAYGRVDAAGTLAALGAVFAFAPLPPSVLVPAAAPSAAVTVPARPAAAAPPAVVRATTTRASPGMARLAHGRWPSRSATRVVPSRDRRWLNSHLRRRLRGGRRLGLELFLRGH